MTFLAGKSVMLLDSPFDEELRPAIAAVGAVTTYPWDITVYPSLRAVVDHVERNDRDQLTSWYTAPQLRALLLEGRTDVLAPVDLLLILDGDDAPDSRATRAAEALVECFLPDGQPAPTDAASALAAACMVASQVRRHESVLGRLLLTVAAVRVVRRWEADGSTDTSMHLLNVLGRMGQYGGNHLLNAFAGYDDPSVWNEDTFDSDAVAVMFPGFTLDQVTVGRPQYAAGERAYTTAYDRTTAAVLSLLWRYTDPSYGFAAPPRTELVAAARAVIAALPALLPDTFIRRAARCDAAWDFSEEACEYVRNMAATSGYALLSGLAAGSSDDVNEIQLFLLNTRFTRMALRRTGGRITKSLAFNCVAPCNVKVYDDVLSTNMWEYGRWKPLFEADAFGAIRGDADPEAVVVSHPPRSLPYFCGAGDGGVLLSLMYLMRYRAFMLELAWQRRSAVVHLRRHQLATWACH